MPLDAQGSAQSPAPAAPASGGAGNGGNAGAPAATRTVPTINEFAGQGQTAPAGSSNSIPSAGAGAPAGQPSGQAAEAGGQVDGAAGELPPASDPWLTELQSLGFEGVADPEQGRTRLLESYRQLREQAGQIPQLQQQMQFLQMQLAMQQGQLPQGMVQPGAQPAAAPEVRPVPYGLDQWPTVDMAQVNQFRKVTRDANGDVTSETWDPQTPPSLISAVNELRAKRAAWEDAVLTRPHEALPQLIAHYAQPMIEQQVQQRLQAAEDARQMQALVQENSWMLRTDPVTGRQMRAPDGNFVYSEFGDRVFDYADYLQSQGIQNSRVAMQMAIDVVRGQRPQAAPAAPQPTAAERAAALEQQRRENQRAALLGGSNGPGAAAQPGNSPLSRDRGNSFASPDGIQNRNLTPGEQMLQRMKSGNAALSGAN